MFLLFKSMAFYSFSLFHFRSRKYVVFSWVLPLSFCLSFSLLPPGGGLYTVLNYSSFLEICVMERNCLGFIPAYSRNKMLYDFVQSFEMFQPGIEPMTSCFKLLPFTSTPLWRMHVCIQSGCV